MKQILQQPSRWAGKWLTRIWLLCGLLGSSGLAYGQNVTVAGALVGDGSYATLGAAFTAINGGAQTGANITISIDNNTTETTAVLNTGAWTSLTISPAGGATRTISSSTVGHMIDLNGADNVTIDGLNSGGNALIISNTATGSSSALRFQNDASNNTITRCTLQGSGDGAGAAVVMFTAPTTNGNDNNNINNCNIAAAGVNLPRNGIASEASSGGGSDNNILNANNISNYFNAGNATSGIVLGNIGGANSNTSWTITNNRLFQTANRLYTTGGTHNGILIQTGQNYTITGNVIGFANASGTGTTNMIGNTIALGGTFPSSFTATGTANNTRYVGINCAFTVGGTNSSIQNNTIGGFAIYTSSGGAPTTTGIMCGISVTAGAANIGTITGNTIGATTGNASIYTCTSSAGGGVVGINISGGNSITVRNNNIGAIDAVGRTNTLAGSVVGIITSGSATNTISNNFIGNTTADNLRAGYSASLGNLSNAGSFASTSGASGIATGILSTFTGNVLTITSNTVRGFMVSGTVITVSGIASSGTMIGTTPSVTINSNFIGTSGLGFVRYAVANSGALTGISLTNTVATTHQINGNDIRGITHTVAGTNSHTYINLAGATAVNNVAQINNNTFTNLSVNTTGSITFINHNYTIATSGSLTLNNNSIVTAFNKTGAGGTITGVTTNGSSANGSTYNFTNNNFSNITVTGATTLIGMNNTDGTGTTSPTKTITSNIFNSWTGGTSAITGMIFTYIGGTTTEISSNTFTNITGQNAITLVQIGSAFNGTGTLNISNNALNNISSTVTGGAVTGIVCTNTSTTINISNNIINTFSSTGTSTSIGISIGGAGTSTYNVFKNKIYDIAGSANGTIINGVLISASKTANIYNNLIGDLRAASATNANAVIGLNITSTTTISTNNVYHNTIYINATGGTNFSTTGIQHTTSTTATTATLNLRNNIIVNTSTATGTGLTVAFRRTSGASNTLANYASTSNHNLFYAGAPSATNLIYADGTSTAQTMANYITDVFTAGTIAPRDANSVSENPTWQSTTGSSSDFLKYSTSVASLADNAGGTGTGITDDFGGTSRSGSTPDMGAWELTITPILSIADNGAQPSAGNVNQGSTSNILQSFTITEGNLANATLSTVTIPLAGTYVATDIQASGLKLWRNTSNSFAGATAFTGVTATASGSGETAIFSSLAFGITRNTTVYFWVTADISAIGTNGNTINANALAPANFTFAVGVPTGSVSAGGLQTILTATPDISLASGTAPVSNPTQNTTNVVLYRVDVTVATTTAVLNAIQFTTAGTYIASDLSNLKIWYHTNPSFTTGTPVQIGSTKTTGLGAGAQSFTGLTQNYVIGTNYIFLTADLPCTATVGNTISVNAIADVDATFATGTFGTNTATGSGTVTINAVTLNNATAVTPTAGNTQVSLAWTAPAGCVNEVMIVVAPASNTGSPTGDGSAYTANLAYNSGTALGNGFVVYKGNTSPQVITGLTNFTTYFFKIFTRNGSAWSSGVEVSSLPQPTYCTTTYSSGCSGDYIDNVTFNTLSNLATGCTGNAGNGYRTVYPASGATTTSVEQGATYTLTLRPSSGFSEGFGVWIDYNKDGDFLDVGEFVAVSTATTNGTDQNFSVSVPMSASLGLTAMRVRCFFNQTSGILQSHACGAGATGFGEAEDYYITVSTPSPQTLGTIASAQATPATTNKNTTNNPILRIDLPTAGALGTLTLTNLVVTSANTNDADVATNGVKLYYTTTTTFSTANPVGTGQSFSSGLATFSGLTRLLANGNNYIWVAYDVATSATVSNTLDAQIAIGNITIAEAGGATATGSVPVGALNPAGSVQIIPRAPLALTATAFSSSQINLSNTANADGDNIMVAWNSTNTFGTPTGTYTAGNSIAGGGTVLYVGTVAGLVNHTGLTANTQYFYSVWTNGGSAYSSTAQTANATTLPTPLNYVFSQSNGTYGEITPTTTLFTGTFDDGLSTSQTIPSFTYNGATYTNMFVSANGFLKLGGGTGPSGSNYTPLSTNSTVYQNIISAFGDDLNNDGGGSATVGWSTVGNEVIVQWKNVRRFNVTGETVNFQIRMNTVTSEINIVYGTCTSGTSVETMQVGIRGFDETWRTQVSNRQGNLEWDKTTMGTNNTSALSMTTTNFPASGLTFTYTPNTCTPFPITGAVTQSGTDVTVNWTAQAEATDGYDVRYRLQSAGIGTYTVVNVAGQASNNTVIAGLSAGTYLFEVRSRCSGTTFSDYSNAVVFNVLGNYYLKAGGVINTLTDWGTNTDGTGANPSALNEANAIWNIRNNATVTNPSAWTLGTASKIIVGDGISATNFTLPTGANVTGTIDVANLGTLTLQNTTNPTLGTLAVGSTVDYNGTGAQTVAVATYSNLTISGARTGSPTITLASGTIGVSNNFTVTTTGVGSYTNTGNTVNFSSASMQTIPALRYRNITNTGNGNRTLASSDEINIAGTFATGTGVYTTTGSTVNYSATSGGGFTMASFNYHNVIFSGTQTFSIGIGNTMNVANDFTLSGTGVFNVNNTAGATNFNVGNDLHVSNGFFNVINNTNASSTTVNITRDLNISGTGNVTLEFNASNTGIAIINVGRNFTASSSIAAMLDFGDDTNTGNAVRIAGNFAKSGTGSFETAGNGTTLGFVFNGTGTQTFSYTGTNSTWTQYTVNSGSTLQMLTDLALLHSATFPTPISSFTVNSGATLDMGTQVITANNTANPIFTLSSGGTIKTALATGLASNFSGFGASRLVLSSGANYEFNGASAQVTSAFVTTPTANTVNNLTINNSAGVTLTNDLTATNSLNMTAGAIDANVNNRTLTLGTSAVSIGTLNYTSGVIVGKFKRWISASATGYNFPIGISTQVRTANITYTGAPSGGSLTAQHITGETGTSGLPLIEGAIVITNVAKAVWQINAGDGLVGGTYTATMNATGLSGITDFDKLVMLKRATNASAWTLEGTHVTTAGSNGLPILQRTGLTGFSEFGVGGGLGNPLPITLLAFTGERNDTNVELDWRTTLEIDLKAYQVEKSYNGIAFTTVGKVDARAGAGEKVYGFVDNENASAYYRLRYLHHNLPDEFSPVVFVRGGEDNRILVYPNPIVGEVKFAMNKQMQATASLTLHVLNAQGKTVATYTGDAKSIESQFNATYSRWKAGVYMLQFQAQGAKQQTLKVVKP